MRRERLTVETWQLLKLVQRRQSFALDFEQSYNITGPQFSVLSAVVSSPGIDQRSVSSGTFIGKSTLVGIVSRLENRDLITVEDNLHDGRRDSLTPTVAGGSLAYAATPELLRRNDEFLAVIPHQRLDEFLHVIETVGFHGQEERRSRYIINSPDSDSPPINVTWGPGRLLRASLQRYGRVWADRITETTPAQFAVLGALHEHSPLTQRALGDMIGTNKASVTEMMDRLLRRGLIRKQPDTTDARRRLLHLTPDGDELLATLTPIVEFIDADFLTPIDPDQCSFLRWGLQRLISSDDGPPPSFMRARS